MFKVMMLPVLLLSTIFIGAADTCGGVPGVTNYADSNCAVSCDHGQKQDRDGYAFCECRDSATCSSRQMPSALVNPNTGNCVNFATTCDYPTGWTDTCPGTPVSRN